MAFWDRFKKKKNDDHSANNGPLFEQPEPLAGIPAYSEPKKPPVTPGGIGTDWEDAETFVTPKPYPVNQGNQTQTYPLTFFRMENNICCQKIDYICYGHERPDDILFRMQNEGILPRIPGTSYRILYWPTQNGISTVEHWDDSAPKAVSAFQPAPGKVFIIEQYRKVVSSMPMHTLYGCPTAALPQQESTLKDRCVDILRFD